MRRERPRQSSEAGAPSRKRRTARERATEPEGAPSQTESAASQAQARPSQAHARPSEAEAATAQTIRRSSEARREPGAAQRGGRAARAVIPAAGRIPGRARVTDADSIGRP